MATNHPLPELMARVALQDRAAFKSLYQATCASLFSVALRILRNENWADDVLQEAYVNIWHNAAAYRPGAGAPMTWMINIVRNKAIDALRSRKAELAATTDLGDEAPDLAADAAHEPQQQLDDSLVKAKIAGCMGALPAAQRQALALAYYRGMVHTEIAQVLNAPLGTAKGWVRRGLEQLKSCLEAAGVAQP
ncbi:MAG: sigma-70 family RNA polymerase sigma factor [Pseudomonadota bacterium]